MGRCVITFGQAVLGNFQQVSLGREKAEQRNTTGTKQKCPHSVGNDQRRRALAGPRGRPGGRLAGARSGYFMVEAGNPDCPGSVCQAIASPAFRAAARVAEGTGEGHMWN